MIVKLINQRLFIHDVSMLPLCACCHVNRCRVSTVLFWLSIIRSPFLNVYLEQRKQADERHGHH